MSRRIEPRSIFKPADSTMRGRTNGTAAGVRVDLDVYSERVEKFIPGEIVGLYLGGTTVIPPDQSLGLVGWALFCLVALVIFFVRQTRKDPKDPAKVIGADKIHVTISSVSFLIWVYALGGPFKSYGLHVGWLALLLMLGWTFLVSPFLYPNPPDAK